MPLRKPASPDASNSKTKPTGETNVRHATCWNGLAFPTPYPCWDCWDEGGTPESSQIVSRSRSPRLSAPHTLHRLRLSLEPKLRVRPRVGMSRLVFALVSPPSAASAAALSWAILSASKAASSASGESGIVSRLEILGLLDRVEVGVDGTDDDVYEAAGM